MENEKYTRKHMAFVLKGGGLFLKNFLKNLISQFSEFWSKGFCISLKYKSIIP